MSTPASIISSLYLAYYSRPADPSGLRFWTQRLEAQGNNNLDAIINAFATSPEAQARFNSLSNADFINNVYQSLFARPAESGGLAYWSGLIQQGALSRGQATLAILQGAQNGGAQDSALVNLRNDAALQFTQSLGSSGAYFGNAAADAATLLIASVQLGSSPSQINNLILAANQLVQMASAQPDAYNTLLGTGHHALGLLNTPAGRADPLGVIQTLGNILDTAVQEAGPNGNPSTALQRLLGEESNFEDVLLNLPNGVTVQDVNDAVSNDGLAYGGRVADTGGGTEPPPTPDAFIVTVNDGVISFSGTATGDITVTVNGGVDLVRNSLSPDAETQANFQAASLSISNLVFSRGGFEAATKPLITTLSDSTGIPALSGTDKLVMSNAVFGVISTKLACNVSLKVSDTTLPLADLTTIEEHTTGFVDATAVTSTSGSVADATLLLVTNKGVAGDKIKLADNVAITVNDALDTALTATALSAIGGATTGEVTVSNAVVISGSAAEVTAALVTADTKVTAATAKVTVNDALDTALAATALSAIGGATTGEVTVSNAVVISGSAAEVTAALVTPDTKVAAATAKVTVNGAVSQADLADIYDATSGTVTIQGTSASDTFNFAGFAAGHLVINGLGADDIITGGNGNDTITGGAGADTLTGGWSNDLFSFTGVSAAADRDTVTDFTFTVGGDRVGLDVDFTDAPTASGGPAAFATHFVMTPVTGKTNYVLGDQRGNDIVELTGLNEGNCDLSAALDGTELFKLLAASGGGNEVGSLVFDGSIKFSRIYLLAYDAGKAYLYLVDNDNDAWAAAASVKLVGTFDNINSGTFDFTHFAMVA